MFVLSVKMNRKRIGGILLLFLGITLLLLFLFGKKTPAVTETSGSLTQKVANTAEMVSYLNSFGWEVAEEPCEIVEISIPTEFNDVYQKYNKLQQSQGFDLSVFKGEPVKRFTFEVRNYPEETEYVRANLLIYQERVIAGDISSVKADGFMQGLQSIHS